MADFLTRVVATLKHLSTLLLACVLGLATQHCLGLLATEASNLFRYGAWAARTGMTFLFTFMYTTVQSLTTDVKAREILTIGDLTRDVLLFLAAMTAH